MSRSFRLLLSILSILFLSVPARAVDVDDLRPGLLASHIDSKKIEIARLEPTIALSLKAGEAAHPRLSADGGTVRWQGFLNVLRPGSYRFSATLRGKLRVTVGGKEVLSAESAGEAPTLVEGKPIALPAEALELTAEFTRPAGIARLELMWEAPHFHREPLPFGHVFHLPAKLPAQVSANQVIERGRFLVEEFSCTSCHRPDDDDRLGKQLQPRKAPDLSQVGQRVHGSWLYHWLENPQKVLPGAAMPRMFPDDDLGKVQRYAVTKYLVSLDGPVPPAKPAPKDVAVSITRGQRLFTAIGCIACHSTESASSARQWPLTGLGRKTTPEKLAQYLGNPLFIDPSGRMPHLLLQPAESSDVARFLCSDQASEKPFELPPEPAKEKLLAAFKQVEPRADELPAFQKLPPEAQWRELGKLIVMDRGCNNCHTIAPGGQPFANIIAGNSFDDLKQAKVHSRGCLADQQASGGRKPPEDRSANFPLTNADRQAIRQFLLNGATGVGSPAPAYFAQVTLERFNCLACHSRNGTGGLSEGIVEELRRFEKAENAEAVVPPPLTDVGHKLRTPWLKQVLTQAGRARPWMGLRMPQFGEANVGPLADGLAALDGTVPDDSVHSVPLTGVKIEAGTFLVGKGAFGCANCHDLAGIVTGGTRGADLASMTQRVRFDWYRRWLEQAQRMQPGTRMPTVFPDGKTLIDNIAGGKADAQAEAMWAYLSLGPTLPLPDGLTPTKGVIVPVKDRPALVRTFLPDAGTKAVAVGYPGGINLAFDAATCRLAYGWTGNFLDVTPVWEGRGGNPATVLGPRFFTAPPGCGWAIADSADPPDILARNRDPAYGGSLPEGKLFLGTPRLHFLGYETDKGGLPTFRYRVEANGGEALEVQERPEPLKTAVAPGVQRRFHLHVPAKQTTWLLVGESAKEPRLLDAKGMPISLDLKSGRVEVNPVGRLLLLPQDGNRVVALSVPEAPQGTAWLLLRQGKSWQALLRLPPAANPARIEARVNLWAPYRDEPGLLKELLSAR